jgi:Fur family transcriptional regulator, zinc uptake regulator
MPIDVAAGRRLPIEAYFAHGASTGLRWPQLRERLLRLIWSARRPLGAYEAAERLSRRGHRTHPTSVYRLLECFERSGLVLPVVTWNRYLLSPDPAVTLWALLLCRRCGACMAVAMAGEQEALARRIEAHGFATRRCCIECEGQCHFCKPEEAKECVT